MKKNIDKSNFEDEKKLAKDFDDSMDKLKKWYNVSEELNSLKCMIIEENKTKKDLDKIEEFFEKWIEEFSDNDWKKTRVEKKFIRRYEKIKDRSPNIQQEIVWSAGTIIWSIRNWNKQKDPVAKVLLRMANMILKSDKEFNNNE